MKNSSYLKLLVFIPLIGLSTTYAVAKEWSCTGTCAATSGPDEVKAEQGTGKYSDSTGKKTKEEIQEKEGKDKVIADCKKKAEAGAKQAKPSTGADKGPPPQMEPQSKMADPTNIKCTEG